MTFSTFLMNIFCVEIWWVTGDARKEIWRAWNEWFGRWHLGRMSWVRGEDTNPCGALGKKRGSLSTNQTLDETVEKEQWQTLDVTVECMTLATRRCSQCWWLWSLRRYWIWAECHSGNSTKAWANWPVLLVSVIGAMKLDWSDQIRSVKWSNS